MRYCKDGLTIKDKLKEEDVCNGECITQCIVWCLGVNTNQSHLNKTMLYTEIPELGFLMHKHMLILPKICLSTKICHYISKFWQHQ